jgi:4-amino-4-deoxy-L-arabinose transferase-like glycosyltransferase
VPTPSAAALGFLRALGTIRVLLDASEPTPVGFLRIGWMVLPAIALVIRLAYVATLPPTNVVTFEADPITYDQIALNILLGKGFSGASFYYPPGSDVPTSFWDPLYPYFLAAVYWTFGYSIPAVRVVQAIIGAVSVAMAWHVGRRLAGPAAGLLTGAILAGYPFLLYYTGQLLTETLFIGLILATVAAGIEAMRTGRLAWFLGLGLAGGLAAMGRAEAFAFTLAYVPWCAWFAPRRNGRPWAIALAVGWLAAGATLAPWTIRNTVQFGRPIITTTKLGYNLYKYYHPQMTPDQTVRVFVPFPDMEGLDEPARASFLERLGIAFMLEDPSRTARFMVAKFLLLFKLVPSNEATRGYAFVSLLSFGVLLPFMAAGAAMVLMRGRSWWPVAGYVAFSVATKTAVFAGIRLRMQVEPFLVLFAAVAITSLMQATIDATIARFAPWARHRRVHPGGSAEIPRSSGCSSEAPPEGGAFPGTITGDGQRRVPPPRPAAPSEEDEVPPSGGRFAP